MKQLLLVLFLSLATFSVFAQDSTRIEVKGKIIVDVEDLENITIYNTSSNKGTVTDSIGNFNLKVALNDEIRISSVQLIPFTTKITEAVIDTKVLKIYLKEYINTLDEVILLPYDLSGDLTTDALDAKISDPIVFNFESFENFEMPEDYHSKVENMAVGSQNDRIRYQLNGIAIIGGLAKLIFKNKKKSKDYKDPRLETPISNISETFKPSYFTENYNIPEEKVQSFIAFLERSQYDTSLLEPKNELKLIEYLHSKSKTFLAIKNEGKE
ncbi:carboxypeptidase-like regulatory domain-containing protein [Lacinutrix sp. Bg11-31]|uniref:carboxypeptidase-like regulatory domain-containing protein n=1 Tax=Lacinutrix sp. Bg11-31 TaxID=2057808 RepID=UPI000C30A3E1|nr:carboxypeptidase-like regulatory domain-containing protein [Lacinutrix sp. Bg11-31]AUC83488.1 hypothetical protein CW733_15660 [Lacinutrix sp. Bg11-31]